MNVCFITPHTDVSGGVKVIFSFAQYLAEQGIGVTVLAEKLGNTNWLNHLKPFKFKLEHIPEINHYTLPEDTQFLISYGDWDPYVPIPANVKHILFFQGFGTQNNIKEKINLGYKYDAVFVTSNWLAHLANRCGHDNLYLTPPGIDKIFEPKDIKTTPNIIGTLYHSSEDKNFKLFAVTISKLLRQFDVHPLLLSATTPKREDIDFLQNITPNFSLYVNPSYSFLPYIYSHCSAWFSPSKNEGFGLTSLEAMACGIPVVWNRSFGLDQYMKHGKNCVIVHDKETGVSGLSNVLQDQNKRKRLINSGLETAKTLSWKHAVNRFIKGLKATV